MKCPHCKKAIRITANPVTSSKRSPPTGKRSVSLRKNPARKVGYTAKYGRQSAEFFAQNDKAAERYANGLLAHKMGREPSSLQRNKKRPPKS